MFLERYYKPGERIAVEQTTHGTFFVRYGVQWHERTAQFIQNSSAGPFLSLGEATAAITRHRPGAVKLNSMCANCTAKCNGTAMEHYTGCAEKTTD